MEVSIPYAGADMGEESEIGVIDLGGELLFLSHAARVGPKARSVHGLCGTLVKPPQIAPLLGIGQKTGNVRLRSLRSGGSGRGVGRNVGIRFGSQDGMFRSIGCLLSRRRSVFSHSE